MSEKDDEKKQPRRFIESGREIIKQIIKERHPGPGCICNECLIMTHNGAEEAKERMPGSFLVEHPNKDTSKPS